MTPDDEITPLAKQYELKQATFTPEHPEPVDSVAQRISAEARRMDRMREDELRAELERTKETLGQRDFELSQLNQSLERVKSERDDAGRELAKLSQTQYLNDVRGNVRPAAVVAAVDELSAVVRNWDHGHRRCVELNHEGRIAELTHQLEQLPAGAEPYDPDFGPVATPGQFLTWFWTLPDDDRIKAAGKVLRQAAEAERCYIENHTDYIDTLVHEIRRLNGQRKQRCSSVNEEDHRRCEHPEGHAGSHHADWSDDHWAIGWSDALWEPPEQPEQPEPVSTDAQRIEVPTALNGPDAFLNGVTPETEPPRGRIHLDLPDGDHELPSDDVLRSELLPLGYDVPVYDIEKWHWSVVAHVSEWAKGAHQEPAGYKSRTYPNILEQYAR